MAVCDGLIVCLEEHTNPPCSEEAIKGGEPGATLCGDKAQEDQARNVCQAPFYVDAHTVVF